VGKLTQLRRALAEVAALSADAGTSAFSNRASSAAQMLLHIDPSSTSLRDAARALLDSAGGSSTARAAAVDAAATALASVARAELARATSRSTDPRLDALAGALADALRRGSPRR